MNRNRLVLTQLLILFLVAVTFSTEPVFASLNNESTITLAKGVQVHDWIIDSRDSRWTVEELELVNFVLRNTFKALENAGFDGQELLNGYRFRRQQGEFVDGVDGRIALVRHQKREVILADSAFLRLQGFYIYHELGHIVDKRLDRELTQHFHEATGAANWDASHSTADGYWLNEHARADREEATADAFALWVVLNYTDNYKPVFWNTPNTINYEEILNTMEDAIQQNK